MEQVYNEKLKFHLELDKGVLSVEIIGNPIEIGEELFLPYFANTEMRGKLIANSICTAIKLAYPKKSKKNIH